MTKTTALRKLIKQQLDQTRGITYYTNAPDTAAFPYKVFTFAAINLGDAARDDLVLVVDIYDKSIDQKTIEAIADQLEKQLGGVNLPQIDILPTFYRDTRITITEDDKALQHIQVSFQVQNYSREA